MSSDLFKQTRALYSPRSRPVKCPLQKEWRALQRSDQRVRSAQQQRDVLRARQAVVAALDQGRLDIVRFEPVDQTEREAPGDVGIGCAMEEPHRAADRDWGAEQLLPLPAL